MRKFFILGCIVASIAGSQTATAQAGISLGAAAGGTLYDGKLSDPHGLIYLRLGLPLVPYGVRGDVMVYEFADDYETAFIGNAVVSLNAPLIQPYALVGLGRYGVQSASTTGVSFGAGVRIGARRGLFLEGRRHDPIGRNLVSFGITF